MSKVTVEFQSGQASTQSFVTEADAQQFAARASEAPAVVAAAVEDEAGDMHEFRNRPPRHEEI